jgi:hypothetical protein
VSGCRYARHYNGRRLHRGQHLRPPRPDHPIADLTHEQIERQPILGGLINEYQRAAIAPIKPENSVFHLPTIRSYRWPTRTPRDGYSRLASLAA